MSFNKKNIVFYLLIALLLSCKKDLYLNIPKQPAKLVVNCLFNPDSTWKVFVGESRPLKDTSTSMIDDAHVTISRNGQSIHLTYLDSGFYVSNLKPKTEIKYTIKVSAPGFHTIEASDRIPAKLTISSYTFDTIPIIITDLLILDKVKVNKLHLSIDGFNQENYAQVKIPVYSKYDLYYYTITDRTLNKVLEELKKHAVRDPSSIISELSTLKNKPILSQSEFVRRMKEVVSNPWISFAYNTAIKYSKRKPTHKHIKDLFLPNDIYATQQPFYNIFDENLYSAFAEGENTLNKNSFLLYSSREIFAPKYGYGRSPLNTGKEKKLELWVDLFTLSEAAYQFKTTFIKQQLNRDNLFRRPVQVYSNIKGGLGIFAGYQKERIRVY